MARQNDMSSSTCGVSGTLAFCTITIKVDKPAEGIGDEPATQNACSKSRNACGPTAEGGFSRHAR